MKDVEVFADLITSISERTRSIVTGLSRVELAWRPDAQGNSIGVISGKNMEARKSFSWYVR